MAALLVIQRKTLTFDLQWIAPYSNPIFELALIDCTGCKPCAAEPTNINMHVLYELDAALQHGAHQESFPTTHDFVSLYRTHQAHV